MREIKFKFLLEMNDGSKVLTESYDFCDLIAPDGYVDVVCEYSANKIDTQVQYTGLLDKTELTEVYDGDIISGLGLIGKIVWSEEDCAYIFQTKTGGAFINQEYMDNFKVIGNIYETPELLTD